MPTYDFFCAKCNQKFEGAVPMGITKATCPHCGNKSAKKQFTAPGGIIFKGSGFYKTDSAAPKTGYEKPPSSEPLPEKQEKKCCGDGNCHKK